MRKRLNLTFTAAEHALLVRAARRARLKGPCQLVRTLVGMMLSRMAEPPEEESDAEWLAREFESLADWEPRPREGEAPKRRRRPQGQ